MLFDTTVRRELARGFGATLVVILTIVLTMFLIRTVGQAASGVIAPQDVVLLLGYVALGHLPTMLALSLFIAIVVSLGRMYRDSEMAIWFASGLSLSRFVRPALQTSWPVLLVVALLLLFVWPWGNQSTLEMRDRYQQRSDLSRVTPGVFQTSSDGRRVFFIERDGAEGLNARNVFILMKQDTGESVTSARSGRLELDGEDRFLVLERGQRNDVDLENGERTLSSFENYRVLAGDSVSFHSLAGRTTSPAASLSSRASRWWSWSTRPTRCPSKRSNACACWACTAASSRWRWRCCGGATMPPSPPWADGRHDGSRPHEDRTPAALPRHCRFGDVRGAGLPVAVLLHRLRRRTR